MAEASRTILVVNDNPDHLDLMSILLKQAGYKTLTAGEGQAGLELAISQRPDMVISDVNMPGLNGIELCRRLRREPATRLTPVMLVSAERVGSMNAAEGLRAGADDYLEAPYDPIRLIAKAARLIERKQGEAALRFQAYLLDRVKQAVIAADINGRIIYWNRFAESLYGWSAAEMIGRDIMGVTLAEASRAAVEIWSRLKAGQSWSGELLVRRRDGTTFPALITNSPIYDDKGALVGVVGTSTDITDRKREEERLKHSERQLAEAQRLARIGNWEWDIEANTVTWSDELYRIFGLEPQQFGATYEAFLERVHPDDREHTARTIEVALTNAGPFTIYHRVILPEGSVRILHGRAAVIVGEDGRPARMFGTAQDVTELRRAEERLARSNEQLRALSGRLQMAREEESIRIAREIHDELGGALTGLKMDLLWISKRLSVQSREAVQHKLQSTLELVDDTVRKVRNISTELRPSVLDDLGLAAAIEWQAREFEKRTDIECRITSLQEDIKLSTEKATALFRIFQEILTNVIRHARATRVEVCLEQRGGDLILKVTDNGVGIKQGETAGAKSLGLLGMRERAMVFGGQVEVAGSDGRGTVVTVRLPLV